jgi:hypothetical protein
MKTYINLNLPFERKFIIQKDQRGSILIGFYKKNPIPGIGRKALEELDNNLCSDQEMVRNLIDPRFYRGTYPKDDITVKAVENMIQAAATTPATDISEILFTEKSMTKEEKEYWQNWCIEKEKEVNINRVALESIINNKPI